MAKRSVAYCNGEYIGIESIYTVRGGCQINIPDKVEALREKSRRCELFCPCGCGANLILVASDKNLREQHFRIKDSEYNKDCHWSEEGKTSIDSKIVLKCWLEDKLRSPDIETRVPINDVDDIERKYEFTFLSRSKRIALDYCHMRANLSDEKLSVLENNGQGISIIHVVDFENGDTGGQYPEGLMKIQKRQGYCLLLSIDESDYEKAEISAVFYEKDIDGFWQETEFASGLLHNFDINEYGDVIFDNISLTNRLYSARTAFANEQESEKKRREEKRAEEERKRLEWAKKQKEIEEENKRRQEEAEKAREAERLEAIKRAAEQREKERIEKEKTKIKFENQMDDFMNHLDEYLSQQDEEVRDPEGKRWIKCEKCGAVGNPVDFHDFNPYMVIKGRANLGICKNCHKKEKEFYDSFKLWNRQDPTKCPRCGANLNEINGRYGKFLGCSNYPTCQYRRSFK